MKRVANMIKAGIPFTFDGEKITCINRVTKSKIFFLRSEGDGPTLEVVAELANNDNGTFNVGVTCPKEDWFVAEYNIQSETDADRFFEKACNCTTKQELQDLFKKTF